MRKEKTKYKTFDELSISSRNFFDYIIKFNCDKFKELSQQELIDEIFAFILRAEDEFKLHDDYFYAENLLITADLIIERIKHYRKFDFEVIK